MKYNLKIFKRNELQKSEEFDNLIEMQNRFQNLPEHDNANQIDYDLCSGIESSYDYSTAVMIIFTKEEIPFAIKYCDL